MNRAQHELAVHLLKNLGLDHIRLIPTKDGHYRYVAWTTPLVDGNGSPKVRRRGTVVMV